MPGSTERFVARVEDPCGCAGLGSTNYENVIEPCRALSRRDPVNLVVVRPNRHGSLANRAELPSAQRHGHGAGAKGEAATAAGASGEHWYSSPERAGRPVDGSNGGRGAAGSCRGEAGPSRQRGQQLQRWLRIQASRVARTLGLDAVNWRDTTQFSRQPARTHSLTGTTLNAWKPKCSRAGTETDRGGTAPAC